MSADSSQTLNVRTKYIAKPWLFSICVLWMLLSITGNLSAQYVPILGGIAPHTTTPGGTGFVLMAMGSNFLSNSVIYWNGSERATTYVNDHQLKANILASDIANEGSAAVSVSTPGFGVTTSVTFSIRRLPPMLGGADPAYAVAGGPGFVLTAFGTFFTSDSVVQWNGNDRTTTIIDSRHLSADILETDIAEEGGANVTVFTPGFGNTEAIRFPITAPLTPSSILGNLNPTSASAGGPGFVLEVVGSNFVSNSVVQWNGLSRETTYVNTHTMQAAIPASDIAWSHIAYISISTPGAVLSNPLTFRIMSGPEAFYAQFHPLSAAPGGPGFVISASGTYCLSDSVIQWNGIARPTRIIRERTILADIPASDIAVAGTAALTVYTPGVGTSTPIPFQIAAPPSFLQSVVPNSAAAGGPGFILMAIGTNNTNSAVSAFAANSVVQWNGSTRPTTFIDAAHLQARIFHTDLASPGSATVTVATPGSADSYPVTFDITESIPALGLDINAGGAAHYNTPGGSGPTQAGYATITNVGSVPSAAAVFRFKNNGVTISEVGVSPSPPTRLTRIFVDYRSAVAAVPGRADSGTVNINTGVAIVNYGSTDARVRYILRRLDGTVIAAGTGTIAKANHISRFINELNELAPDFELPSDFQTQIKFATLDIVSNEPLSVTALRGTSNQRNDFLITATPVADLSQAPDSKPAYFPQFADGGGYTTSVILLNTSSQVETGTLQILEDDGIPIAVHEAGGNSNSSFQYSIPPYGAYRFQSDGSPSNVRTGWVRLTPNESSLMPVGLEIFSFNPDQVMVTETGIPAAASTNHARMYIDLSNQHNTGIALANPGGTPVNVKFSAFQTDGITRAGNGENSLTLAVNGHTALFATDLIQSLPPDFKGVLDVSSKDPFAALALRCHKNERNDFLMTTFPIADSNKRALAPILFPQVADGGGYGTEFIFLSPAGASSISLSMFGETGAPMNPGD